MRPKSPNVPPRSRVRGISFTVQKRNTAASSWPYLRTAFIKQGLAFLLIPSLLTACFRSEPPKETPQEKSPTISTVQPASPAPAAPQEEIATPATAESTPPAPPPVASAQPSNTAPLQPALPKPPAEEKPEEAAYTIDPKTKRESFETWMRHREQREERASVFNAQAGFNPEALEQLRAGMNYEAVTTLLGAPGMTITADGIDRIIYRWSNGETSLIAQFEYTRLIRWSSFNAPQDEAIETPGASIREDQYRNITGGMTIAEVLALFDIEAHAISDSGAGTIIYRWADEHGASFAARFEDGKLVRKSGMYVRPLSTAEVTEPEAIEEDADESPEEIASNTAEEDSSAEGPEPADSPLSDVENPQQPSETPLPGETTETVAENTTYEEYSDTETQELSQKTPRKRVLTFRPNRDRGQIESTKRVRVLGASRRARQEEQETSSKMPRSLLDRSYRPKAKLPDATFSFRRGSYEIRICNEGDSTVKVGLRNGKNGEDFKIRPGGKKSLKVDKGNYELYYIFSDNPYQLQRGETIPIDGEYLADVRVELLNESASIGVLDYSQANR